MQTDSQTPSSGLDVINRRVQEALRDAAIEVSVDPEDRPLASPQHSSPPELTFLFQIHQVFLVFALFNLKGSVKWQR